MARYDPNRHHRCSIRWKGYDYSQPGAYFVTICTQHRECLFGAIADGEMTLNEAGQMIEMEWGQLPERFPMIELDAHIVMPNHFHGIIVIVGAGLVPALDGATTPDGATTRDGVTTRDGATTRVAPTVGGIVGAFKSLTTNAYIRGVRESGWPPFDKRLWQRNYYERVIRDEQELNAVRQYIHNNPAQWKMDAENPDRQR
jgi:putative transposase